MKAWILMYQRYEDVEFKCAFLSLEKATKALQKQIEETELEMLRNGENPEWAKQESYRWHLQELEVVE